MTALARVRRLWRLSKQAVLDRPEPLDPADEAAWNDAVALWNELFEPFSPVVQGADVLELGCGDGRLLAALTRNAGVRSALGLEQRPYWSGKNGGVAWNTAAFPEVELHPERDRLESLDEGIADLILARELDGFLPLEGLEMGLERIYGLLRPGGEMIARLRCFLPESGSDGPGYGFMTPTAWVAQMMAAGFEIAALRRVWREPSDQRAAAAWLPDASDDERLTAEIHLHLIRPWESWELDLLNDFGDQPRSASRSKKRAARRPEA